MNSKIKFIFLFLLVLPLSSAVLLDNTSLGTFKQNSPTNLIQGCQNSTYSNITQITYPDSTFALNTETIMTKVSSQYNYTFLLTQSLGTYSVYGHCNENLVDTPWTYTFTITPTGQSFVAFPFELAFILLSIILMVTGLSMNKNILQQSGALMMVISGIIVFYPGFSTINSNTLLGIALGTFLILVGFFYFFEVYFTKNEESDDE